MLSNNTRFPLTIQHLIKRSSTVTFAAALLLFLTITGLIPQGALWYESSMTMHMLVQFPLLIISGAIAFNPKDRFYASLVKIDPLGAIAFICFTGMMWFWMLPINLDLATIDPATRLFKLLSVPVGIGFCFRWLWHRLNGVFKCVILFEIWASVTRLGWLYIESPEQLCSSYLIGEQQQVGTLLLLISAVTAAIAVIYSLFGSFNKNIEGKLANHSGNG